MTHSVSSQLSVLFVCLGNICELSERLHPNIMLIDTGRSPMAEGVFRHLARSNPLIGTVDSCGTSGYYHAGEPPDPRTMSVLEDNGITDYDHCARTIQASDLDRFDYVLVMDAYNLNDVQEIQRREASKGKSERTKAAHILLFGDFGGIKGEEVVDPYYGARDGFQTAYEQMVRFSSGFLKEISGRHARLAGS